jgi:hypothetical protein
VGPPPLRNIGYGVVNYWDEFDPDDFAAALAKNRVGLTEIEYTFPDGHTDISAAARFVTAMRGRGIWTFVNVVNSNNESARNWARQNIDTPLQDRVDEIVDVIGPDHVMMGAVSEPDGREVYNRWTRYAREHWAGEFVLPANYPVVQVPTNWRDLHYCNESHLEDELGRGLIADRIFSTDCTPILNPGTAVAEVLVTLAKQSGNTILVYDGRAHVPDFVTLDAIGHILTEDD